MTCGPIARIASSTAQVAGRRVIRARRDHIGASRESHASLCRFWPIDEGQGSH
jgi:hypothetical protein